MDVCACVHVCVHMYVCVSLLRGLLVFTSLPLSPASPLTPHPLAPFFPSSLSPSHDQATFHIAGEPRPREFKSKNDEDLMDVVITIVGQLKNTLPLTPYK